jgi:hypothetical protein
MVTIVSVGYGDVYPYTPFGKTVATATMLSGVLIIALPVTVLATNFAYIYTEWDAERRCSKVEATFRVTKKLISRPAGGSSFEEKFCAYQGVVAQLERIECETNLFVELCAFLRVDEDRHVAWLTTVAMQPQMVRCMRCLYTQMSFNESTLPCVPVGDDLEVLPIRARHVREKEARNKHISEQKEEPQRQKSWAALKLPSNNATFFLPNPPLTAPISRVGPPFGSADFALPSSKADDAQSHSFSGLERSPSNNSLLSLSFDRSPLPSEIDLVAIGSNVESEGGVRECHVAADSEHASGGVRMEVAGAAAESSNSIGANAFKFAYNTDSNGGAACNLGCEAHATWV